MPKVAHRLDAAGNIEEVSIEALVPGERILVKPGEKIPLDGKSTKASQRLMNRC